MSNPPIRPLITLPGPGTNDRNLYTQMAITVNELINQVIASGGTVTHTGALTLGRLIVGNVGSDIKVGDLSGDVTTSGGTATVIGAGKVTNSMLAGSIDLTTKVTGVLPVANGGLLASSANVSTDETQTAGASYGNLATTGPNVTLTTGTSVIIWMSALTYRTGGAGNTSWVSVDVSGATTIAASDTDGANSASTGASFVQCLSRVLFLSGLTAGSNTFTLKYRNDGGSTWHFVNRSIAVLAL